MTRGLTKGPTAGLPAERTVLAWVRTMLAYGVCALLALRLAGGSVATDLVVLAVAATGTGGIAVLVARRRHYTTTGVPVDPVVAATLAGLVAGLGFAAAVLVATH